MGLAKTSIIIMISLGIAAPAAYADLSSATYTKAREEYTRGDCYSALPLLKKYKNEDIKYLESNQTILVAINDAIDYCHNFLFSGYSGDHIPLGPPRKPDLPVNLTHAFDTEARLRSVIAELKSGKPDFDQMEPMLRISIRQQLPVLVSRLQTLGSLLSISFEGQQQGADVYEVKFTNGTTAWMIGISSDGFIRTLNFQ